MIQYVLQSQVRNQSMENYVSGHDRPLYFKRPVITTLDEQPLVIQGQNQKRNNEQIQEQQQPVNLTKTVEVQTDYRESETQTIPYTPKYVITEGENPEVLTLANFKYGNELPATIDELEQIESAREKIWFDNALPPISDESSFSLRRKLMEEQELREWKKKENTIRKVQNEKLYLLQSALIEREKEVEDINAQRIEEIKIKKTEQKNSLIAKIQRRKIKVLRKLLKRRKEIDEVHSDRDIIEQYANFGSKVYAGITREGLSIDKIANKYEVQPVSLQTYQGINDLNQNINPKILETKVDLKKLQDNIMKGYTRLETHHKSQLKKAQDEIQGANLQVVQETTGQNKFALSNMFVRPPTPVHIYNINFENKDFREKIVLQSQFEKREKAVILLQRLLRGRAVQNIMYEGKEKRLALIEELLTVAKIQDLPEDQIEEILIQTHEEKAKNAMIEALEGEVVADTLCQLSKELLKLQQERKIQKMVEKAENDRKLREIEESGKRQAEQILTNRQDILYGKVMEVHQGTVDSYLSSLFANTIDQTSHRQAIIMSKLRQEKLITPVEQKEREKHTHEVIIKDLMNQFLIPNVQRLKIQKQIDLENKRFQESSKKTMINTLQQLGKITTLPQ